MVGTLTAFSAGYIAGYVTKNMRHASDPRLRGRHPEFSRMSNRPGLGANAMHDVASEMMRYSLEERGDVPTALRHGTKYRPLGRYLRRELRKLVGKDAMAPPEGLQKQAEAMSVLRAYAWKTNQSVSSVFSEMNEGYSRSLEAKLKLFGGYQL